MIAEELPKLATQTDSARHLDALPRRYEAGDSEQSELLRNRLFFHLHDRKVVPDQDGHLRLIGEISYPPKVLTDAPDGEPFEFWAACPGRPRNWLHNKALTPNRLAAIGRLFPPKWQGHTPTAPRASIAEWLEALVQGKEADNATRASRAAVQIAATIPPTTRSNDALGDIVLTASLDWRWPDPKQLFLPQESHHHSPSDTESYVHPELVSHSQTLSALKKLGLRQPSPESAFRLIAERTLKGTSDADPNEELQTQFWLLSRKVEWECARDVISECKHNDGTPIWPTRLRVRTRAGTWQPPHSVLFPGKFVPDHGRQDDLGTVDTRFHGPDSKLLRVLGVTEAPHDGRDLSLEPPFRSFRDTCRKRYSQQDNLPYNPDKWYLGFKSSEGVGPLAVLTVLSDEGNALYTEELLRLDASFEPWTMRHKNPPYPPMQCESFTIHMLREHGRVRTRDSIVPMADVLGSHPKSLEALHKLLAHPKADKIKAAFGLAEPIPEFLGEGEPLPLTDVWPGLKEYLPPHREHCRLILCERILVLDQLRECVFHAPNI